MTSSWFCQPWLLGSVWLGMAIGEGWSDEANKYVKEIVINKMVRMTLQDMKTGVEDECKVMMFELGDTQGFSIF